MQNKLGCQVYSDRIMKLREELEAKVLSTQKDADRYRFLRDADNWGEDSGDFNWNMLGDTSGVDFDIVVDERMRMHHDE